MYNGVFISRLDEFNSILTSMGDSDTLALTGLSSTDDSPKYTYSNLSSCSKKQYAPRMYMYEKKEPYENFVHTRDLLISFNVECYDTALNEFAFQKRLIKLIEGTYNEPIEDKYNSNTLIISHDYISQHKDYTTKDELFSNDFYAIYITNSLDMKDIGYSGASMSWILNCEILCYCDNLFSKINKISLDNTLIKIYNEINNATVKINGVVSNLTFKSEIVQRGEEEEDLLFNLIPSYIVDIYNENLDNKIYKIGKDNNNDIIAEYAYGLTILNTCTEIIITFTNDTVLTLNSSEIIEKRIIRGKIKKVELSYGGKCSLDIIETIQ